MTDYLKSAIGLFTSSGASNDNEFVGQNVEVGQYKLRIRRVIAEGGYAIVYHAFDLSNGKEYALKRMFASEESAHKSILAETALLKRVASHSSCIRFIAASSNELQGRTEYLLLTEYCPGALIDFLRQQHLVPEQILLCFHQICLAVQTLHHQQPPIAHRDLKLENVLIGSDGRLRLCDFGSASQKHLFPDEQWTASQRAITEDDLAQFTTPMYRSPEMIDLYSNMPINQQVDIWALGCLLFFFCFQRHPFEDSAKLRIINAKYTIPEDQLQFAIFHELIRSMLRINPTERPTIDEVVTQVEQLAAARRVDLRATLPIPASAVNSAPMPVSAGQSSLFSSLKGGANQLFRGIKNTSNKVIDQVVSATSQQPVGNAEPPSYVLPRLLIAGHPEARFEDFKRWLESRHGPTYAVWNLSEKTYPSGRLCEGRVSECGWLSGRAPNLDTLYHICDNVIAWLRAGPQNVAMLHCLDGRASSAVAFAALTQYAKLLKSPESALNVFAVRRHPPAVTPSQLRYLHYVRDIVWHDVRPHACAVRLIGITMQPVPILNRNRTGCTPFIEVHMGERRIASTGLVEYERLRQYTIDEPSVTIPLEGAVTFPPGADITITLFHARSTIGSKMQGRLTGVKVCSVQFNTGMLEPNTRRVTFGRMELDGIEPDRVSDTFRVAVELEIAPKEHVERRSAWCGYSDQQASAHLFFKDEDEMRKLVHEFDDEKAGKSEGRSTFFTDTAAQPPPRPPPPGQAQQKHQPQAQPPPQKAFFDTLSWGQEESERLRDDVSDEGSDIDEPAAAMNKPNVAVLLNFGDPDLADDEGYEEEPQVHHQHQHQHQPQPHQAPQKAALLDLNFDAGEPAPPIKPSPVAGFPTDPFAMFGAAQTSGWSSGKTSPSPVAGAESPSKNELDDLLNFDGDRPPQPQHQPQPQPQVQPQPQFQNTPFGQRPPAPNDPFNFAGWAPSFPAAAGPTPPGSASPSPVPRWGNPQMMAQGQPMGQIPRMAQVPQMNQMPPSMAQMPQAAAMGQIPQMPQVPPRPQIPRMPTMAPPNPAPQASMPSPRMARSNDAANAGGWKPKPKVDENTFGDILSDVLGRPNPGAGAGTAGHVPRTLGEMQEMRRSQDIDPNRLKVERWTAGKRKNIRALLCSLHTVLWDGSRWQEIQMHQLVTADQVKKCYRKAALAVHPDKLTGTEHEPLAKLVFFELNEAWAQFELEGCKSLTG